MCPRPSTGGLRVLKVHATRVALCLFWQAELTQRDWLLGVYGSRRRSTRVTQAWS